MTDSQAASDAPTWLPWGCHVEEGPEGWRVLFSDGKGLVEDVTHWKSPRTPLRYWKVGPLVEPPQAGTSGDAHA